MDWPQSICIKEVGPRDGLQNEKKYLSTEDKVSWINSLALTGLTYIEISSFVNPKWVPALHDALEVAKKIDRKPGVTYAALVPNQKGLEKALQANIDETAVFMSASESHNKKNINKSIAETFPILKEVVHDTLAAGKTVRGYLSAVFSCPYEGKISIDKVLFISEKMLEMGISELSLGDTIGTANPTQVEEVLEAFLKYFPKDKLAMHFHNTYGMALANILISLEMGITTFDASLGGLGGCPYAPGASGNIATDDLNHMMNEMGISTGINQEKLLAASCFIEEKIGRTLPSHALKAEKSKKRLSK
ncbi:hydroxymethylglutaryl-CoA lyase [Bacillus taeanensis]|uniref:Hydroxymethylglutaryl-CoA lyase n=1 Tax=Bacillus taeanensis TaxID=273032 RepID=A0A366XV36_9BACI|nr:hydroxymethylglutaryl-CoA lyase [Bacillus taeanensis]RBW67994.1 hydroxymethylglutaryl-CoA lyase [Bacillus taeanensis]